MTLYLCPQLRRMEHRVGDLGEGLPTTNHSAYLRPTGTVVCTTSEVERSQSEHSSPLNARREPLARVCAYIATSSPFSSFLSFNSHTPFHFNCHQD